MILQNLYNNYGDKKVLLTSSDNTGCGHHRVFSPYLFLKDSFTWMEYASGYPANDPRTFEADVIWLQRANHEYFKEFIPEMRKAGKKFIYDLDDTLWHIPASNFAHRHYPRKELDKVDAVISQCDCITTSTKPLADFLSDRFQKETFIIPNHIWMNEMNSATEKVKNEKIKIGWAGSYTHQGDFDHHLVKVLRGLPKDKVDLFCMGHEMQFLKPFAKMLPWVETTKFHDYFIEQNWDIGIMVAQDNMFNKCKSNLKYLEYGAIRCASIGHSVYPYTSTIEDGVDGLLVKKEKTDWKDHIYRLIEDEPYRLQLAENSYQKVKKNFTYEENYGNLENIYLNIFDYLYKG